MAKPTPPQGRTDAPEPAQNLILDAIDAQKNGAPPLNRADTLAILNRLEPSDRMFNYDNVNQQGKLVTDVPAGTITIELHDASGARTLGVLQFAPDGLDALVNPSRANVYVGHRPSAISLEEARRQKEAGTIVADAIRQDAATLRAIDHLNGKTGEVDAEGKPVRASEEDLRILQKEVIHNLPKLDELTATIRQLREQGVSDSGQRDTEPQGNRIGKQAMESTRER